MLYTDKKKFMKHISKLLIAASAIFLLLTGCDKVDGLPFYNNGTTPVLSSTVTDIAPAPADSLNEVVTFSWTDPGYANGDAATTKYVVQIDSAGRNFSQAYSRTVIGELSTSFTAKELNDILLGYGFAFNVAYDVDVRVVSSYGNNNEQYNSNTLTVKMTPYKIPPKIALPASGELFLVGDASYGGWNNPVPTPSQQFTQLDETTFAGVFNLYGGKQYLVLPVNGSWDHKYSVEDNTLPNLSDGGDFGYDLPSNFPGPATDGQYVIKLDFQLGKFTVTPYVGSLPTDLFIVGDATPGGWTNPVPVPSQQFTRLNSSVFEITTQLYGGKQYLMLPVNGSWDHKYAVADNTLPGLADGGEFGYDLSSNFPGPASDGNYKIQANFATNTFTVTPQ